MNQPMKCLQAAALLLLFASGTAFAADAAKKGAGSKAAAEKPDAQADEKAIRASADEFVKAFNKADAKAIGAMWAEDGEYTDESGVSFRGREAIEKEYAAMFKAHKGATTSVKIESVRLLGPDVAIEKGVATTMLPGSKESASARYTVVHARRDGKWTMVVGRDAPYVAAADDDYLKDLAFLIGDWKAEGKDQQLTLHYEWMAQKNFIKNTFTLTKDGKSALAGGQIIGWDPKLGQIVSWHFDAQGGFGHDVWQKDGDKWLIGANGILRDGSESSALNTLTRVDDNAFLWKSGGRTLDGVPLPDMPEVKVVRVQQSK